MGIELNAINDADVQQSLTRAFGLRDRVPVPTLAPELQAVVLAADLTISPPFDRKRIAAGATTLTSGGASAAFVQLRNPATSGVVARVTEIWSSSTVAQEFVYTIAPITAGAVVASGTWINSALPGIPACELAAGAAVARPVFWRQNIPLQGLPVRYNNPIILTPGFSIMVETIALAATIQVSFGWEEFLDTPVK